MSSKVPTPAVELNNTVMGVVYKNQVVVAAAGLAAIDVHMEEVIRLVHAAYRMHDSALDKGLYDTMPAAEKMPDTLR